MVSKYLLNITPRDYQISVFEKCKNQNTLVVLPTGVGKTLIALMLIIDRMEKFPTEKVLFLAPTRPLAEQHLKYFKSHLPELFAQMDIFTGKVEAKKRKELWERSDIVFSTPQCIGNDIKNGLYDLQNVSLLIEDEAHRCVKNYSYTYVAKEYIAQAKNHRILGMTASPGTTKEGINLICKNLSIEAVEIRTRESDDVKEYLQDLDFKTIKLNLPIQIQEIRALLKSLYEDKIHNLKERNLLHGPANKITLLECQRKLMRSLSNGNKNYTLFQGISSCTQAIKLSHALELVETQTLYGLIRYLEDQMDQAEKNKTKSVKQLVSNPKFTRAYYLTKELIRQNIEHPKINELKSILGEKISFNPKAKTIIFSQYRDSVSKIAKELNTIPNISAKVFVGQSKKTDTGLSQKEQKELIEDFSTGKFNVLCATSIGEEGLDIPEVNSVIFYEPVPSAIRKIQRAGRTARLMPGELIILITNNTRDEGHHWASINREKGMHKAMEKVKEDLLNNKENQRTLS